MQTVTKHRLAKAGHFLLAVLVVGMLIRGISQSGPGPGKMSLSKLEEEFRSLPVPADHVALENVRAFDKGLLAVAGRQFHSRGDREEVFRYYADVMPQRGWAFSNTSPTAIRFCKGTMNLTVDIIPDQLGTVYYLGIAWTDDVGHPRYCGSK